MIEIIVFVFGIIIGSFLNMLIYRLPLGISLINPKRSQCPRCKYIIKWYENIPILSYFILKGKCSNCKQKISCMYPLVELMTGIITVLIYSQSGVVDYGIFTILGLFYILIVLSFIDFKYKAVPDYLLILLLIVAFLSNDFDIVTAFIFAGAFVTLELFVTFYIQNIKARILKDDSLKDQKSMGEGDIPIVAVIGGLLGIKLGLVAIFLSAIFAIVPSLINLYFKKDIETPFIPYLVLSLFVVFINKIYFLNLIIGQISI